MGVHDFCVFRKYTLINKRMLEHRVGTAFVPTSFVNIASVGIYVYLIYNNGLMHLILANKGSTYAWAKKRAHPTSSYQINYFLLFLRVLRYSRTNVFDCNSIMDTHKFNLRVSMFILRPE